MIEETVRYVYSLLQNKQYGELAFVSRGNRLSADELKESINEYGCKLIPYPDKIGLDVIEVEGSNPKEWSVVAPIFTVEEGLSDLSIELSLIDNGKSIYSIEVDNIRVR